MYKTKKTQSYILLYTISLILVFRNSITVVLNGLIANALVLLIFAVVPMFLKYSVKSKMSTGHYLLFLYFLYSVLLVLLFPVFSTKGNYLTAIIGFTNLICMPLFWFVVLSKTLNYESFKKISYFLLFLGGVNAVGAIIQTYVSIDLFGLINHNIYTDQDTFINENVNVRAVSFITSPQSLSLFLAFSFSFSFVFKSKYMLMYKGLILFAGALTVSKAFFVFLITFFVFSYLSLSKSLQLFASCFLLISAVLVFQEQLDRITEISYFMANVDKYSAYPIWSEAIEYGSRFPSFLFGNGIGVFSRGGQQIGEYVLLSGSTESFIIQLFVELGLVGILMFLSLVVYSANKLLKFNRHMFGILMGFLVVSLFTPAIYGYSSGLIFYFILVLPLATNLNFKRP
ncbi:hypothetical protein A3Q34_06145 [Colwellia sp. PAMC 20917]|uniref:hypothetical protein n=1 Tax=Colwellia sp. PAMC 20917 TaxID=1816218 RepID=UPI0008791948|nr:hypothetical protein [Colwellia sp. PAMC 20917]AOW76475.1 hypothetical protein A3Q34_06145 [Colwellia sp. PAMC 20917]